MLERIYLLDINRLSKCVLFDINALHFVNNTFYHYSKKSNSHTCTKMVKSGFCCDASVFTIVYNFEPFFINKLVISRSTS